jgi:hypothetical protein
VGGGDRSNASSSTRKRAVDLLARALARVSGTGPVVVPEYGSHPRARYGWDEQTPVPSLASRLDEWADEHHDSVAVALADLTEWARSVPRSAEVGACWENDYWGGLDAVWQVRSLRDTNPARYVEVGSGYSTLFARQAITDFDLRTRVTSIDPSPRREVDAACDEVIRTPLEDADLSVFETLQAGDVVLVDGSHVVGMNSDAVVFFLEVLPQLAPGVLVGIDDVYLPWDYHPTWVSRGYGEQYLLAAYLLGGAPDAISFPGFVVARALADDMRLADLWSVVENRFGRLGSSFWFERA